MPSCSRRAAKLAARTTSHKRSPTRRSSSKRRQAAQRRTPRCRSAAAFLFGCKQRVGRRTHFLRRRISSEPSLVALEGPEMIDAGRDQSELRPAVLAALHQGVNPLVQPRPRIHNPVSASTRGASDCAACSRSRPFASRRHRDRVHCRLRATASTVTEMRAPSITRIEEPRRCCRAPS